MKAAKEQKRLAIAAEKAAFEKRIVKIQKARERRNAKAAVKRATVYKTRIDAEVDLYRLWQAVGTSPVLFVTFEGSQFTIRPGQSYKDFRADFAAALEVEYDAPIEEWVAGEIRALKPSNLTAERIMQAFRDGVSHCVFEPIKMKLEECLEKAVSKSTKDRLRQRLTNVTKLEVQYMNGVPESHMEEVAIAAGSKIMLFDVMDNHLKTYHEKGKTASFHFTNTRANHLDSRLTWDSEVLEIPESEMKHIYEEIKRSGDHYIVPNNIKKGGVPSQLRTLRGSFKTINELMARCRAFDDAIGVKNYQINARQKPDLNKFLKASRHMTSHNLDLHEGIATGCLDMKEAYTQDKQCPYYVGLMGMVHQFRSGIFDATFMRKHLGFYRVALSNVSPWFQKLGFRNGYSYILFTPEITYLLDQGMEMTGDLAALGSRLDVEYPPEMLEKVNGKKPYAIWAGRTSMEYEDKYYTMPGDRTWAKHLMSVFGEHNVKHYEDCVSIRQPSEHLFTSHQILSSIVCYQRINMMVAMDKFQDKTKIVRIVADGIFYTGEAPTSLGSLFREKPVSKHTGHSDTWYACNDDVYEAPPLGEKVFLRNSLLMGQGGCGKTHTVLNDTGFTNVLYVVPSNRLGAKKQKEFEDKFVRYTTIHKLIGMDCRKYKEEHRMPPVILIDEATQIDKSWIDQVFVDYPDSLILIAGDIDDKGVWYQCRSGDGSTFSEVWKPKDVETVVFTSDYRSLDDTLKAEKLVLRTKIRELQGHEAAIPMMTEWARKRYSPVKFDPTEFKSGDICIVGDNVHTGKRLLEMGIVTGYFKKGIGFSEVDLPGYEKKGGFTVHSFQGETVQSGTLFIFCNSFFEETMLYTAVSRARRWSQIRFVKL